MSLWHERRRELIVGLNGVTLKLRNEERRGHISDKLGVWKKSGSGR